MKIYFAGAIRGGRQKVDDYIKIVEQFEKCGGEVISKHFVDPKLSVKGDNNMTPKEIYERDIKWLEESDIVFADITVASLGVGYEIAYAEKLGKKIYAVYEKEANVSGLLRGSPNIELLEYSSMDEVMSKINKIMK